MVEFDQFWAVCARRVAKLAAEKAFNKARKLASLETLIEGMKIYAEEVRDTEPQFIAHPATWLNQGRWMDEREKQEVAVPQREVSEQEFRLYLRDIGNRFADAPDIPYFLRIGAQHDGGFQVPEDWTPKLRIVS